MKICKRCNIETEEAFCPKCHSLTSIIKPDEKNMPPKSIGIKIEDVDPTSFKKCKESCPKCGNGQIETIKKHELSQTRRLRCNKCRHSWNQDFSF